MRSQLDAEQPHAVSSSPSTPITDRAAAPPEPTQRPPVASAALLFEADLPSRRRAVHKPAAAAAAAAAEKTVDDDGGGCCSWPRSICGGQSDRDTIDPQGRFYIAWLSVVSLTFLYNAWVIPMRSSFPFQTPANTAYWLAADYGSDIVYTLDVLLVKHRLMYLYEGFWVRDETRTRQNYMRKLQFKLDLVALLPLDLLYFVLGTQAVFLRAPRLLKIQSFWEFFKLMDRVNSSPHMVRMHMSSVGVGINLLTHHRRRRRTNEFRMQIGARFEDTDLHAVHDPHDRLHILCVQCDSR